ncbi:MAG: hypothetical protein IIB54_11775 [Planctomycetes bacterium]|nr:hypothetical protein [Planctomycetota bacterium]
MDKAKRKIDAFIVTDPRGNPLEVFSGQDDNGSMFITVDRDDAVERASINKAEVRPCIVHVMPKVKGRKP